MFRGYLLSIPLSIVLIALLADRWLVLSQFSFIWTDDDQVVLWSAARDLGAGIVREPRFYGQAYNTWLEALLAAPLLRAGLSYAHALPLVTCGLALLPFVLLASYSILRHLPGVAALCLSFPVMLSLEYAMITSMPRGFVTGLAVASVGASLLCWGSQVPSRLPARRSAFGFFLLTFAISVNPNALPLSLLVGAASLLSGATRLRTVLCGVISGAVAHLFLQSFYWKYPDYNAHQALSFNFSPTRLAESLPKLMTHFSIFLMRDSPEWVVIAPVLLAALIPLVRGTYWPHTISSALAGLVVMGSLGFEKLHDGSPDSIYQPLGRFFLSVPVLAAIMVLWAGARLRFAAQNALSAVLACSVIVIYMTRDQGAQIEAMRQKAEAPEAQVQATQVERLHRYCARLMDLAQDTEARVIVFAPGTMNAMPSYACDLLVSGFPPTLFPRLERRTWRLYEEMDTPRERVLLVEFRISKRPEPLIHTDEIIVLSQAPLVTFVKIEPQPVVKYLLQNGFKVRSVRRPPFRRWLKSAAIERARDQAATAFSGVEY